jgi:glycolate oxidase FAD binding subunit
MDISAHATLSELRERLIAAHQNRRPLRLRGAGTKDFYGESAPTDAPGDLANTPAGAAWAAAAPHAEAPAPTLLDLRPYRGIVDYEPSELVITARCGTPLSEIEAALADRGQFLPFEPPGFGGDPTIGGVIATGLSGPRRMYAGAARDFVLGATLLEARGEILRFGGQVMKNVAGFDVSRLLCGSLGILGVITEVSLKVLPRPRAEETLRFQMPARKAVEAFNRWSGQPLPLSGAAWCAGVAWVRLSGAASAVRAAHERMGGERVDQTEAAQWWDALRHCSDSIFNSATLWRLSVPDTAPPLDLPGDPLIDWGGALRWYANVDENAVSPASTTAPHAASHQINPRQTAATASGTAICWRGPAPPEGRFHPLQPAIATLHRRLKARFDPHGIFNPGRLLAGL